MRHDTYATTPRAKRVARALEILPGLMTWTTLIGLTVLSFYKPVWVALFIIVFDVYFLARVAHHIVYLITSFRKLRQNAKVDWSAKLSLLPGSHRVKHIIIIPTYKESFAVLKTAIDSVLEAAVDNQSVFLVMAYEERAGRALVHKRQQAVQEAYGDRFAALKSYVHPDDIPGEIAGKGSNQAYAMRQFMQWFRTAHPEVDIEDVLVSVFDADTILHKHYFSALTHAFLTTENPHRKSYQPIPFFFNNLWDSPGLVRLVGMSATLWMMTEQGRPERLVTFSSHSMSLKALLDIGYWSTDVVSEDSRVFWQAFIRYNGDYAVHPLFIPIYMDTVLAETYWKSLKNQYKQMRRWAYGIENIPYIVIKMWRAKRLPWKTKLIQQFRMIESFYSWATYSIMLFILSWLPIWFGGEQFHQTYLANSLPFVVQVLMTVSSLGIVVVAILYMYMLPTRPAQYKRYRVLLMVLQWLFVPFVTILLGSIPAIEAQTRVIFKRYLGFWVTDKVRKSEVGKDRRNAAT